MGYVIRTTFRNSKPRETESSAEVYFMTDSCCLIAQPNYLNNSNKDCDWLILPCFMKVEMHAYRYFYSFGK